MNARRYLDILRADCEVWMDVRRVSDVATEPALREKIAELARIYDLQNSPEYRDEMTCIDPDTRQRISVSWLFTRSPRISKKKRRNLRKGRFLAHRSQVQRRQDVGRQHVGAAAELAPTRLVPQFADAG
jgi:aromatic ring hydroxylase